MARSNAASAWDLQMRANELLPTQGLAPFRGGCNAVPLQNIGHRFVAYLMSEVVECPSQAPIAPIPILACQLQHQLIDSRAFRRGVGCPPVFGAVELLGHKSTMPPQDGFGSDDLGHFPPGPCAQAAYPLWPDRCAQNQSSVAALGFGGRECGSRLPDTRF